MHRLAPSRLLSFVALVCVVSLGVRALAAQEPPLPKPGPEHKTLEKLVGNFDGKIKMYMEPGKPPVESTMTLSRSVALGGFYIAETVKAEIFGMPFEGRGLLGYNPRDKKYFTEWADSMSPTTTTLHGTYDEKTKSFHYAGDDVNAVTGKKMKARDVVVLVSENEQRIEMYRTEEGGNEQKVMEISLKRKK